MKELREAEKLGMLQSKVQNAYEKLQNRLQSNSEELLSQNEPLTKSSDKISIMLQDDIENIKKYDEPISLKEKYQTIFENYTIAITLADNNERIISWNKYTEELFNMNESDLYMKPVKSLYPPEEWKKIRGENIRTKGIKYRMETKMIRNNQGLFDVEISLCVLKGKDGKIVGSVGIIKDITQLKKTEKALKESEEKYRTIFENSAVAIMLADENEQIISWNKYTEELLGIATDDLYLKPVETLYPIDEWKKIRSKNIREKGLQHHMETRIFKINNKLIDIDLSLSVLKNHEGNVVGTIGVIKDISERKQLERNLLKSEKKFKQLYEKAPVPYHTLSENGEIISVNEKWCQILGYTNDEVIGKSIFDFIVADERESAKSSFRKKIKEKNKYSEANERKFITRDGGKRIFVIRDFFSYDKKDNLDSINTIMIDITKQKKIDDELKSSKMRFQDLALCSADWIWEVDKDGIYTYTSGRVKDILGYNSEELIGKTPFELMPKNEACRIGEIFGEIASNKQNIVDLENWNLSKKGEMVCLLTNGIPLLNDDGELIGYRGVDKDITERKKAEEELKENRKHFQTLFNAMVDPVVIIDSKGKFLEITDKVEEITGYKKEELLGKNFLKTKIVTGKSKRTLLKSLIKRMAGIKLVPYEIEVLTKDGEKIPHEVNAAKIDYMGKSADMVVFRNISDRKKVEEEFQKLASVVKHSSELVNLATLDGKMIFLNESGGRMLGINPDEVQNHVIFDVIPEDLQSKVKNEVIPSIIKKGKWEGELQYKNIKTGVITDVHAQTFMIKDSIFNKPLYLANVSLDITARKKADEELKEAHKLLKTMNNKLERKVEERTEKIARLLKQKDDFINQLGHDLKTPLVPFVILTPMLKKHLAGKPKILKIVDTLESSTNHIKNMVDKTLQLAKLNSSKVTFEFEETNLVSEINDAIENNQYLFNENNIDVKNMVDEEIIVNADKSQLEEVFTNLFTNAIKYSQDNKGNIVIDVKKGKDDDEVIVSVKDDGIGITMEQQVQIFDEFYKIDSSRHDLGSSGLGLSICKQIIEKHGGQIWVESPGIGKGCTFYFTLKKPYEGR